MRALLQLGLAGSSSPFLPASGLQGPLHIGAVSPLAQYLK